MVALLIQLRAMWFMTAVAQGPTRVFGGRYLREIRGLGRILFMAAPAKGGDVRQNRFMSGRVVRQGVRRLGTVAGLARYVGVLPCVMDFRLVLVAENARFVPGVGNGLLPDDVQSPWTVVAVLAEGLGNECGTNREKDTEGGQQDCCGSDQVAGIAKKLTHGAPL